MAVLAIKYKSGIKKNKVGCHIEISNIMRDSTLFNAALGLIYCTIESDDAKKFFE